MEFPMRQFLVVAFLLAIGMLSDAAHARKIKIIPDAGDDYVNKALPDNATVWHCWYDGATAVLCRLGEVVGSAADSAAHPAPVDPRLPKGVHMLWQNPAAMAGARVTIPLHSVPFDMVLTGKLADSVMCGGAKRPCGVIFGSSAAKLADLVVERVRQLAARAPTRLAMAD